MSLVKQISEVIQHDRGRDAADHRHPDDVANIIVDKFYEEYLDSLPGITETIRRGQADREQKVS